MTPISLTVSPVSLQRLGNARGIFPGDDDDHAEAAVEGAQHIVGRHLADVVQPVEDARGRPGAGVEVGTQPIGQAARHVAGQAAAGDVGQSLDRAGRRE